MVVNLRRGAPDSGGTTLPSAGGLLRDPSCTQLDPSRTLLMGSCYPGVKSCVQSVGAAPKKMLLLFTHELCNDIAFHWQIKVCISSNTRKHFYMVFNSAINDLVH